MNKRQGEMKKRIQEVAIELFTKQGYDKTSLREIAERLDVSKAALYYHFKSKEEILRSIIADLLGAIDELIAWGESLPRSTESREDFLRRIASLLADQLQPLIRFVQVNGNVMKTMNIGSDKKENMSRGRRVIALVCDPEADLADQLRGTFALSVLFVGISPIMANLELKATSEQIAQAALDVALELISKARSMPTDPAIEKR
jgi:AcrR family transcriptional regulator